MKWELVVASFTLWEHLHLLHLLGEASIQPVNFAVPSPSLCSRLTFKVLQRHPNNGSVTSFRNWPYWGRDRSSAMERQQKAAAMFSQAGFSGAPHLTCSQGVPLTLSSKGTFLLRDQEHFRNLLPGGHRLGCQLAQRSTKSFTTWAHSVFTVPATLWRLYCPVITLAPESALSALLRGLLRTLLPTKGSGRKQLALHLQTFCNK